MIALVDAVDRWSANAEPQASRDALLDAARQLATSAGQPVAAARLLLAAVPWQPASPQLLAEVAALLTDRPAQAAAVATGIRRRLPSWITGWQADGVHQAALQLHEQGSAAAGLLACELAAAGTRLGWPPPWQDLVHQLRRHQEPDVRDTAVGLVIHVE